MKKIKFLIIILISLFILPNFVSAATGTISVSGASTAVVGNKVTVTVKLASTTAIGSWQMNLNYDKNYLKLTSSSAEAGGTIMASSSTTGVKNKTYTYTFTALKKGSTSVSVGSYLAYAFSDLSEINLSPSSKTIKIMTQDELEATYSKNNNLKSLSVEGYTISPEFSSDVTSYNVVVPEDTKQITVNAIKSDSKSTVTGDGTVDVTMGSNNIVIIVRAENGSEKTYNLTVDVKDSNPIAVTVDNIEYTVVKIAENLKKPASFDEKVIQINEMEIPAFYNEKINITLVGLKDTSGNIYLFIYNDGKYEKYSELNFDSLSFRVLKTKEQIKGYSEYIVKINDIDVKVLKYTEKSRYSLIYGENLLTGEQGFFMYDKENNSLIRYNTEQIDKLTDQNQLFMYIIIGGATSILILLIILFTVLNKKNVKNKSKDKNKYKNNFSDKEEKEIIEITNEKE